MVSACHAGAGIGKEKELSFSKEARLSDPSYESFYLAIKGLLRRY
jgi:hypothetical protein